MGEEDKSRNVTAVHLLLTVSSISHPIFRLINDFVKHWLTKLTECLRQQLNAGCVGCQSWTYSRVDAHVRQHPDQLHQHVLNLLHTHWRRRKLSGGRGTFPWVCVRWVVSALVAVVQLQECVHAALALKELQPSLVAFRCEVPEGEKKAHDKVLWESGGE